MRTEVTGAMNAAVTVVTVPSQLVFSVQVHMEIISTPESLTSPNQVQVQYRVESEQRDLSEDENSVLEVQCEQKGEWDSNIIITPRAKSEQHMNTVLVRGRLKQHIDFWQKIGASEFIISTICKGYKIPFRVEPAYSLKKNNNSAKQHSDFVSEAITEFLESERISEVQCREKLHVINPLTISVQPSGKRRLILDLRVVNQCLHKRKVTFDDHKKALEYFKINAFIKNLISKVDIITWTFFRSIGNI